MNVKCPTCDKAVAWLASSKFRPFCSERCKLIDFGDWADGNFRVPGRSTLSERDMQEIEESSNERDRMN